VLLVRYSSAILSPLFLPQMGVRWNPPRTCGCWPSCGEWPRRRTRMPLRSTTVGAPRWCGVSSSTWRHTMRCLSTEESHTTWAVLPHHTHHLARDALPHHMGPHGLRKLAVAATRRSPSWHSTLGRRVQVRTSRPPCRAVVRTTPAIHTQRLSPAPMAADTRLALPMQALQAGYTLPGCPSNGRTESAGRNRRT
jgi:hypothetical protein